MPQVKGEGGGADSSAMAALEAELSEILDALRAAEEALGALGEDADVEARAAAEAALESAKALADEKQAALDLLNASGDGGDDTAMATAEKELDEALVALASAKEEHEKAEATATEATEAAGGDDATDDAKTAAESATAAVEDAVANLATVQAIVDEKQAAVDALRAGTRTGTASSASGPSELAKLEAQLKEVQDEIATVRETLAALTEDAKAASEGDDEAAKTETQGAADGAAARLTELEASAESLLEAINGLRTGMDEDEDEGEDGDVDPDLLPPASPEVEEEARSPTPEPEIDPVELLRRKRELVQQLYREQTNQADYIQRNTTAQAAIAEIFRRKSKDVKDETAKTIAEQEERYTKLMSQIELLEKEFDEKSAMYTEQIGTVTARRDEVQDEVAAKQKSFYAYKRKIAKQAVSSKTGKPMKEAEWNVLEAAEKEKDERVRHERLKYIKLRNQLRMKEGELKEKEQLAEGLHFIDFEQLKIENQTYNEKIEERNEELSKLRNKITMTVQVLSHLKEKLHFVEEDNIEKKEELMQVEADLAGKRDSLSRSKRVRDQLRRDNQSLIHECGLIGKKMLLRDFENQYDELEEAKKNMTILQARYAELVQMTQGYKERLGRLKDQEPDLFRLELPPLGRD